MFGTLRLTASGDDGLVGVVDGFGGGVIELVGAVVVEEAVALELEVGGLGVDTRRDVVDPRLECLGHADVGGGLLGRCRNLLVGVTAVGLPLLPWDEGPDAAELSDHRVSGAVGLGIAREGVAMDIVHITELEVVGRSPGVGVDQVSPIWRRVVLSLWEETAR